MKYKLIIFDFDGTLADTTDAILACYSATMDSLCLPRRNEDECRATIGVPLRNGFEQLYPDFDAGRIDQCLKEYRHLFPAMKETYPAVLFEGVGKVLVELHEMGSTLAVASSRTSVSLKEMCGELGISKYFSRIYGAEDVARPKPAPDPVLKIMEECGINASATAVVGDMPVDIAMGKGAGCFTVGVTMGNSTAAALREAGADVVISKFADLLKFVS